MRAGTRKSFAVGVILTAAFCYGNGDHLYQKGAAVFETEPARALKLFEQAAEAGNVSAMVGAGHCYENGLGVRRNYAKAISFYERAMGQKSNRAVEGLCRIHSSCPYPKFHNGALAVEYAKILYAEDRYDPDVLDLLAMAYLRDMQPLNAMKAWTTGIQYAGSVKQAEELKEKLKNCKTGKPIPDRATDQWMREAANKDIEWAVVNVAHSSAAVEGKKYDPELAVLMCEKGIKMGCRELYRELGLVHFNENRLVDAYVSFEGAAENGIGGLEISYRDYLVETKEKVFEMAGKLKTGYSKQETYYERVPKTAYDQYGRSYNDGYTNVRRTRTVRVPPSPSASKYLYLTAAKMGHPEALKKFPKAAAAKSPEKTKTPDLKTAGGLPIPIY